MKKGMLGLLAAVMMTAALAGPVGVIGVWAASRAGECRSGDYWVRADAAAGGPVWLVRARDMECRWDGTTPAMINPSGDCGRPADAEPRWMIYSHNWACDGAWCPHGLDIGGENAWPDLPVGSGVTLCTDGQMWRGKVTAQIFNASNQGIQPQTPFKCSGQACGSLAVCAGLRAAGEDNVTRVSYWKVH